MANSLHSITLNASEGNWRLHMTRKADQAFLSFTQKVLHRDQHTCQFCGFQNPNVNDTGSFDVVNLNGNYHQNTLSNLITACPLCSQCFFLESIDKDERFGGVLIYCPEMDQNQLNALCHLLFTAMMAGSPAANESRNIYRALKLRSQLIEKKLGEGLSQPTALGCLLVERQADVATETLKKHFAPVMRLLPDYNAFAPMVAGWCDNTLTTLRVTQ